MRRKGMTTTQVVAKGKCRASNEISGLPTVRRLGNPG